MDEKSAVFWAYMLFPIGALKFFIAWLREIKNKGISEKISEALSLNYLTNNKPEILFQIAQAILWYYLIFTIAFAGIFASVGLPILTGFNDLFGGIISMIFSFIIIPIAGIAIVIINFILGKKASENMNFKIPILGRIAKIVSAYCKGI